jgi:hypothetical protein
MGEKGLAGRTDTVASGVGREISERGFVVMTLACPLALDERRSRPHRRGPRIPFIGRGGLGGRWLARTGCGRVFRFR